MKKTFALALGSALMLAACSSVPTPAPAPIPVTPTLETVFITPSRCKEIRVRLEDGSYSRVFGVVPAAGFSLAIPLEQIECRVNGAFVPLKR